MGGSARACLHLLAVVPTSSRIPAGAGGGHRRGQVRFTCAGRSWIRMTALRVPTGIYNLPHWALWRVFGDSSKEELTPAVLLFPVKTPPLAHPLLFVIPAPAPGDLNSSWDISSGWENPRTLPDPQRVCGSSLLRPEVRQRMSLPGAALGRRPLPAFGLLRRGLHPGIGDLCLSSELSFQKDPSDPPE